MASDTLPTGRLRFAKTSQSDKIFSLRYPASHPADLSAAGASLSSTATGDVSLRIAENSKSSEVTHARRWAGRQPRATEDVECVVAWDTALKGWVLHRVDNLVQLACDDPEPSIRKLVPVPLAAQKPKPLPQSATILPQLPNNQVVQPQTASEKDSKSLTQTAKESSNRSAVQITKASESAKKGGKSPSPSPKDVNRASLVLPVKSDSRPKLGLVLPTKLSSGLNRQHQRANTSPGVLLSEFQKPTGSTFVSNPTMANRFHQRPGTTLTISSPGEQGPIPVAEAEEIEEFDFVESPVDPEPVPKSIARPLVSSNRPNFGRSISLFDRTSSSSISLFDTTSSSSPPINLGLHSPVAGSMTIRIPFQVSGPSPLNSVTYPDIENETPQTQDSVVSANVDTKIYERADSGSSVVESDSDSEEESTNIGEQSGTSAPILPHEGSTTNLGEPVFPEQSGSAAQEVTDEFSEAIPNSEDDAEGELEDSDGESGLSAIAANLEAEMLEQDIFVVPSVPKKKNLNSSGNALLKDGGKVKVEIGSKSKGKGAQLKKKKITKVG